MGVFVDVETPFRTYSLGRVLRFRLQASTLPAEQVGSHSEPEIADFIPGLENFEYSGRRIAI